LLGGGEEGAVSTQLDLGQRLLPVGSGWCPVVLVTAVLMLAGCGDDPATVAESAEVTASAGAATERIASARASTESTASAGPSNPPTAATSTPSTDPSASPTSVDDYQFVNFVTPTGNIRCSIGSGPDGDGVRCDIGEKTWESPPKEADCEFDWGNSLYLSEEESGFACVSDAIDPVEPLPYGEAKTLGRVECTSRETGVRCEHLDSKHGFELSRARYSLF
jgi:hypothetical protein